MLYRTLKRMIERGNVKGISKKIDIFYAAGKLLDEEYSELVQMLNFIVESSEELSSEPAKEEG